MTVFVLVPGSWHDGQTFDEVAGYLRRQGHEAYPVTLAGHGKGVPKNVTHDDCVRSVTDLIAGRDLKDVVLLGHSFAGTVISRAVQVVPERIKRLVFWNAFVLENGQSLMDAVPPHYQALFNSLAAASSDNTVMLPFPIWREAFVNDADAATAQASYETLSPEPFQPLSARLDLTKFYELVGSGQVACSYINCTEDTALPQGPETGWHPRMSSRLGLFRLVQMPGSHEVLFTNPSGLADAIIAAGRD